MTAIVRAKSIWLVVVILSAGLATTAEAQSRQKRPAAKQQPVKIKLPASVREKKRVDLEVVPVDANRRRDVKSNASTLDTYIESKLLDEDTRPRPLASDEVFLRRVYLDVAGRIPTLPEAVAFLESKDPQRREQLIDDLLSSPDYVSNFYNFWADTLRLHDRPSPNIIGQPYLAYIKQTIAENRPYDQWVYEMLTANGKIWENPAVGFQLRDDGQPLPYIDNTVRVFLGTQIGCAQCHDHPFDQWAQYQFYELAAFTTGTRTRIRKGDAGFVKTNPANALINEARKQYDKGRVPGSFQRLARANTYAVSEVKAQLRLPHDYAYSDADPKSVVEPEVLWGEIPSSARDATPREQFAAWLTDASNERFSQTVVNRIFRRFMGVGFVEPYDDFRDEHPCVNEDAMEHLCDVLIRSDFDLKELMRTILYSQTYQRQATDYDITSGEKYYFPGPTLRRMSAEQVWDSILTLAVHNPWPFQRPTAEDMHDVVDVDFTTATFTSLKAQSEEFARTYDQGALRREQNKHAYQGNVLCRASELPAPLPNDHFLRQFGQSDRETIDGSATDATVPQILAMFNGPITHVMMEPGSAIVDNLMKVGKAADRVDAIFLSVLSRKPNSKDRVAAARELGQQARDSVAYGNITWALLNTREFLFIP